MKIYIYKSLILTLIFLLILSQIVYAGYYIERLRELDTRILCFLLFIGPLIAIFLLSIGGLFFIVSQNPEKREEARSLIYNALLGLIILIIFIFIASYIGNLNIERCL